LGQKNLFSASSYVVNKLSSSFLPENVTVNGLRKRLTEYTEWLTYTVYFIS